MTHNGLMRILGRGAPTPALNLMTSQLNDIERKVDRTGNVRRWKRDRRECRIGKWRFNRGQKLTASRRDLPPAGLSEHVAAGENVQCRRACSQPLHSLRPVCPAAGQDRDVVFQVRK